MRNYKIEVTKDLKKYTLIRKAGSELELKDMLHKEGFSILSTQIIEENIHIEWSKFYFEFLKEGDLKTWTILSNDIFKAYLKIKDSLWYNILYIYQDPKESIEEKKRIIYDLEEKYKIYLSLNKKEIATADTEKKVKTKVIEEIRVDDFQMKKEIEEIHKIIDKVLGKIKFFLESSDISLLDYEKVEILKKLSSELIKFKSGTNISKLRKIGEEALKKIGEIELQILSKKKDEQSRSLLTETNKLLKEVGSRDSFIPKEEDIVYRVKQFINDFIEWFKTPPKPQKLTLDTTSNAYLQTSLLIKKYKEKLKQLQKEKLSHIYIYILPLQKFKKIKENYALRESVLNQNLTILKLRLQKRDFSYTKLKNEYYSFESQVLILVNFLKQPIFYFTLLYTLLFLLYIILYNFWLYTWTIGFYGLFYFLLLNLIFILLQTVRGFFTLWLNIVIFISLFILWVINF